MATTMKRSAAIRGDARWAHEAHKGRARLYPVTAFYTAACLALWAYAFRAPHRAEALGFLLAGVASWTLIEYLVHRYVLHGRFPDGPNFVRHFLHVRFDHLHWGHHERPWDADHINGRVQDTLPFVTAFAVVAAFFPLYTAPVLLAGIVQCYVIEEWIHHSVHFYHFRNPYFRYIRKHHLFHHSPRGSEIGYGLTNGLWDIVLGTRIPEPTRSALYRKRDAEVRPPEGPKAHAFWRPWLGAVLRPCTASGKDGATHDRRPG